MEEQKTASSKGDSYPRDNTNRNDVAGDTDASNIDTAANTNAASRADTNPNPNVPPNGILRDGMRTRTRARTRNQQQLQQQQNQEQGQGQPQPNELDDTNRPIPPSQHEPSGQQTDAQALQDAIPIRRVRH